MKDLDYTNNYDDINILIKDQDEYGDYGFAYITRDNGYCNMIMYQSRIDRNIEEDSDIIDALAEGKAYVFNSNDLLMCINEFLDFWGNRPMEVMPYIDKFNSIRDAIKSNPDAKIIFYQG